MQNCPYFKKCGACTYQLDDYSKSKTLKLNKMKKLFDKQKEFKLVPSPSPYNYRHKVIFTFYKDKNNKIKAGLYKEDSHKVIAIKDCMIQDEVANNILKDILILANKYHLKVYHEDLHRGLLRHVQIRTSHFDSKALVTFVLGENIFPGSKDFLNELKSMHKEIVGIIFNYNSRSTSVVLGEKEKIMYGNGFIKDKLGPFTFEITSKSFYQVNPELAYLLYQDAIKFANINKNDIVLDAYCGTGTISLFASLKAKKVVGVEINKQAIISANRNKRLNKIDNVEFVCSDVEDYMLASKFDVVICDPPRSGMSNSFINTLLKLRPRTIVYISCNPLTLKRDLNAFRNNYYISDVRFYDQFAFTDHLESICVLTKKK